MALIKHTLNQNYMYRHTYHQQTEPATAVANALYHEHCGVLRVSIHAVACKLGSRSVVSSSQWSQKMFPSISFQVLLILTVSKHWFPSMQDVSKHQFPGITYSFQALVSKHRRCFQALVYRYYLPFPSIGFQAQKMVPSISFQVLLTISKHWHIVDITHINITYTGFGSFRNLTVTNFHTFTRLNYTFIHTCQRISQHYMNKKHQNLLLNDNILASIP